jgi:membrane protein
MNAIKNWIKFIETDIWKIKNVKGSKLTFHRWLKIIIITIKEIQKDELALKSSAITYFSVLSIVPVFAVIFGVAKAFGFAIDLKEELAKFFVGQEVVMNQTFIYAQKMLDNAQGGLIAVISIVFLIYTVMRLLDSIEAVFNSIWNGLSPRTWVRKFTDYIAIVMLGPILIMLASGSTVFIASQVRTYSHEGEVFELVAPAIFFLLKFAPYIVFWLLFTLLYIIMPNTKVRFKSGLLAGIIAGTVFQLLQLGFITFQIGVARYNAIYGSLAALPLFLIFTQLSWMIVFVGGELSFAIQTVKTYIPDDEKMNMNINQKRKIGLLITHCIVKNFERGSIPLTMVEISESLKIPVRFINELVHILTDAGVIIKSNVTEKLDEVFLPSIDINKLNFNYVFQKLNNIGTKEFLLEENEVLTSIDESLTKLNLDVENSNSNKLLKDF